MNKILTKYPKCLTDFANIKYNTTLKEFVSELLNKKDIDYVFFEISKCIPRHSLTNLLSNVYNDFKDIFDNKFIELKIKNNDQKFNLLALYYYNKLNHCKTCGAACEKIYCSFKCSNSNDEVKEKKKLTVLKNYGVENPQQSEIIKKKQIQNSLKKYGVKKPQQSEIVKKKTEESNILKYNVKSPLMLEEIKKKIKQTNLKKYGTNYYIETQEFKERSVITNYAKYGTDNPAKSSVIKEKIKQTNILRYNVENPLQNEDIKEKVKKTNLEKYGVHNYAITEECKEKVRKTNFEKYGVNYVMQSPNFQEKSKRTNLEKYGVEKYVYKDIKNFNLYNNKEFFIKNFILDSKLLVKKASEFFNVGVSTIYRKAHDYGLKQFIPNVTSENEIDLFNFIKNDSKIQNNRSIINPLELDIVIPDINLAIEHDGIYWHSTIFKDKNYHLNKTLLCKEKGYQLFHIFETDNIEIWKSIINNKLGLNETIYARKCIVKEISNKDAFKFCDENHLQGGINSKINLGLFYNNQLVQVLTFGKPRFNKKYQFELLRLCSKKYINVVGGASKLYMYFVRNYDPINVISYANLRFSNGLIYEKLGFKMIQFSEPNYFYYKNNRLESRIKYQKHKLKNFESYSDELTESQIMEKEGYLKIYDCGNLVYEWNKN